MERIWLLLLCVIVLSFFGVVYAAIRSWAKMTPRKRIAGLLLLAPHFLLAVSIGAAFLVSFLYGAAPQGSRAFSIQFITGVLIVFILPVPALVGTLVALGIFLSARTNSGARP